MTEFWDWLQDTELAFQIGATWWFPLIESIHVVAMVVLIGSILMADLRLLGVTARQYAPAPMSSELTHWAWGGFALAVVTGAALFISRPGAYAANPAFQIKLALLICAGVNVFLLRRHVRINSNSGKISEPLSTRVKVAGGLSLTLWIGIIVAGRWVGHLG